MDRIEQTATKGLAPVEASPDESEGLIAGATRVWMADDDHDEHLLMSMAIDGHSNPYQFTFFDDGAQLLDALNAVSDPRSLPNALVVDLRMPRFDGWRTLEELQADPVLWQVPTVVFTTSSRLRDEAASYQRGAISFETKPSTFAGMEAFLDRISELAEEPSTYLDIDVADTGIADLDAVRDALTDDQSGIDLRADRRRRQADRTPSWDED